MQAKAIRESKRKYYYKNREKIRAYHKKYRVANRDQSRDYHLRRDFKIDLKKYNELFELQGGVCYICKRPETRTSQNGHQYLLVVDHDHSCCSGKSSCGKCIRKLLCHACNVILGMSEDNVDRLRNAASYIEAHRGANTESRGTQ